MMRNAECVEIFGVKGNAINLTVGRILLLPQNSKEIRAKCIFIFGFGKIQGMFEKLGVRAFFVTFLIFLLQDLLSFSTVDVELGHPVSGVHVYFLYGFHTVKVTVKYVRFYGTFCFLYIQ